MLGRGFIFIRGINALQLLQNVLTCDVFQEGPIYGFLLTPTGRFLFDIFIIPYQDGYLLDVYNRVEFIKRIKLYKLNLNFEISEFEGYVGWSLSEPASGIYYPESRFCGFRMLKDTPISKEDLEEYNFYRVKAGVSDPQIDLIPDKSIILEHHMPQGAISFEKGCYVGQELIARTYYTGVLRKKMMTCEIISGQVQYGEELEDNCGKIYSIARNFCLVMLRLECGDKLKTTNAILRKIV